MTVQKVFNRDFVLCLFVQFIISLVVCILIPALPIYLSKVEAKEAEIGLLIGIFSISSLVLRPIVGRAVLKTPERNFMVAGACLYILCSIVAPYALLARLTLASSRPPFLRWWPASRRKRIGVN